MRSGSVPMTSASRSGKPPPWHDQIQNFWPDARVRLRIVHINSIRPIASGAAKLIVSTAAILKEKAEKVFKIASPSRLKTDDGPRLSGATLSCASSTTARDVRSPRWSLACGR